jgi:hypothetical protein
MAGTKAPKAIDVADTLDYEQFVGGQDLENVAETALGATLAEQRNLSLESVQSALATPTPTPSEDQVEAYKNTPFMSGPSRG